MYNHTLKIKELMYVMLFSMQLDVQCHMEEIAIDAWSDPASSLTCIVWGQVWIHPGRCH